MSPFFPLVLVFVLPIPSAVSPPPPPSPRPRPPPALTSRRSRLRRVGESPEGSGGHGRADSVEDHGRAPLLRRREPPRSVRRAQVAASGGRERRTHHDHRKPRFHALGSTDETWCEQQWDGKPEWDTGTGNRDGKSVTETEPKRARNGTELDRKTERDRNGNGPESERTRTGNRTTTDLNRIGVGSDNGSETDRE